MNTNKSVNKPWGISDKHMNRYGKIWSELDFELDNAISSHQFRNDPLNTNIGNLKVCGKTIPMKYKHLISAVNIITEQSKAIYFEKPDKSEKFGINIGNHDFYLKKHEVGKLAETLEDTADIIMKTYKLGLYL